MRREDKERMDTLERLDPAFAKDMTLGVMNALTDVELLRLATGYADAWRILPPSADGIADRYGLRKRPEEALRTLMGSNGYKSAREEACSAGSSRERWRVLASAFPDFTDTELAELLLAVERVYRREIEGANTPMEERYDNLILELENEATFYREFLVRPSRGLVARNVVARRSNPIGPDWVAWAHYYFVDRYYDQLSTEAKEIAHKTLAQPYLKQIQHAVEMQMWKAIDKMKPDLSGLPELTCSNLTIQEDNDMTTKFFETKYLLNTQDISQMSDEQIYAAISKKEADIAKLEAINTKPKRLIAQIEEAKNELAELIAHLDKE